MNVFQRAGSGVDLEIYEDMGLAHVQFRHAPIKPVKRASERTPRPWQCAQGRGAYVTTAEPASTEAVIKRLVGGIVAVLVLCLLAHVFAHKAQAQTLGFHLVSAHSEGGFNNVNPGVYYAHDVGPVDLVGGVYVNSLSRPSVYAAVQVPVGPFDLAVGAVSGYQKRCANEPRGYTRTTSLGTVTAKWTERVCTGGAEHTWTPMLVPSYAFRGFKEYRPRLSLLLADGVQALHLSIERDL